MKYFGGMKNDSTLVIFSLVAALGLMTVVAVDMMLTAQEAEAKRCVPGSIAFNASQGRCLRPDVQSTDEATIEDQVEGEENEAATNDDQVEGVEGEENESEDDQDEEEDDE
ncbi:MAG TPA: hypothetical protein VFR94_00555 [Nitrososphaeraceae archaeon]|nr:hypothetical protein [Nitrososphaeraceae archaeon]